MLETYLSQVVTWSNGESSIYDPKDPDWMFKTIDVFSIGGFKTIICPNKKVEILSGKPEEIRKVKVFYVYDEKELVRLVEENVPLWDSDRIKAFELTAPKLLGKDIGTAFAVRYYRF